MKKSLNFDQVLPFLRKLEKTALCGDKTIFIQNCNWVRFCNIFKEKIIIVSDFWLSFQFFHKDLLYKTHVSFQKLKQR